MGFRQHPFCNDVPPWPDLWDDVNRAQKRATRIEWLVVAASGAAEERELDRVYCRWLGYAWFCFFCSSILRLRASAFFLF